MSTSPVVHTLPGPDTILRSQLKNGLTVLVRENFTSPSVVVDGMIWGGAIHESREKAGLARFATRLMTRGTQDYSFASFYDAIESNGASLDLGSGNHTITFGSKSLAEDLSLMLELLQQALRYPTFPEDYIEKVRGQMLTELHHREQNTRSKAKLAFKEVLYPETHPYHKSASGYLDTIPDITQDDLVSFHSQLGPQDGIIVIVGAIKAEETIQQVSQTFEEWENPNQLESIRSVDDPPQIEESVRQFVPIPGKSQADIVMGFAGPRRSAADFQAVRIANSILGQFGMYGRLGDTIREDQGLAYYSYSKIGGGLGPLPWEVNAGVAPENVDKAIESIQVELKRMVEEPVTEEELADNKSYFKGSLVIGLETNDRVASVLSSMELYDLGMDYLLNYHDMIDAITIEDVQRAAQAYLDPEAYALAVAGPE